MGDYLTDSLKDEIQSAYRRWLSARNFKPRRGQREMIGRIARALTGDSRQIVIEAGTGTGKTAAYCLAAIPIARALNKKLVVSSATVALQEQVVLRDIPDLKAHAGLVFDYRLAKGRGRYVCLKRLDDCLQANDGRHMSLFDEPDDAGVAVYKAMLSAFGDRSWDGELDSWADGVDPALWQPVTTDHRGCANNRCGFFRQCPFFKARGGLEQADVIVANHDLVLADLSLGGGVVLPEPEQTVYVIDEAHHLPDKARQHLSLRMRVRATRSWLDTVNASLGTLTQRSGRAPELLDISQEVAALTPAAGDSLAGFDPVLEALDYRARDEHLQTHRFALGRVGEPIQALAGNALVHVLGVVERLEQVVSMVQEVLDGTRSWPVTHEAEDWLGALGQLAGRGEGLRGLLQDYSGAQTGDEDGYRRARWVNRTEDDFELISAPVETGILLRERLFDVAYGVVCTSATLTAAGRFDRFLEQTGLGDAATCVRIESPFDFRSLASFEVPDMRSEPRDFEAHSTEIAERLPELLAEFPSALVLFMSWRQMLRVCEALPEPVRQKMWIQGEGSRQALIGGHRDAVDSGRPSYLVGLASFAEGLDLANDYCRHVIIAKIPFAVPDDPLDEAEAEWAQARGRNPFYEISVPDAALRLVQACGRLIRNETDYGRITLLDRRIVRQRYGRTLLESLPPYRLVLPE